jgi:adhesin transport system outer membrane protein
MKSIPIALSPARPALGRISHPWHAVVCLGWLVSLHSGSWATCIDEGRLEPAAAAAPASVAAPLAASNPRGQLQMLVHDALQRSNGIGAARLLAEAAEQDVEEALASKKPMASINALISPEMNTGTAGAPGSNLQVRGGVTLSQTFYDGGRSDRIVDWRRYQAEAARLGLLSTREQITLATTSLAFERSRFRMQAVIYGQQLRKMACLVESLQTIVQADKGRTSELVQARKQLQQTELQQTQAQSQARQVEAKLRRIVGDGLPGTEGMSTLLLTVPDLPGVLAAAERSADIGQLDANTRSLREMARVVEAGNKPQLSWSIGSNALVAAAGGTPHTAGVNAGITLNIPLLYPSLEYSAQAAGKRADAAGLQRAEVLEQRRQRIVEVYEQADSAFDRLRRIGLVLRDSDLLRNFTLQQWQQLGRRSLFDVIAAETDHYGLRVQYVNALHDGQQMNAMLTSLGIGLANWLQ